jgi:hypothetical protein
MKAESYIFDTVVGAALASCVVYSAINESWFCVLGWAVAAIIWACSVPILHEPGERN